MRAILQQSTWLLLAQIITRGVGFFYTLYLAKELGVSNFGSFSAALAYFSLISAIGDFGFNRYLVLEISTQKIKTAELISNITILRLTLTCVLFAIFSLIVYYFDQDKYRVHLTLLTVMAVIPLAVAQTLDAVFVGIRRLEFSAGSLVFLSLGTTFLGAFLIHQNFGATGAAAAIILGHILYLVIVFIFIKSLKINIISQIKMPILKKVLLESLPYGFLGVLGLLYFKVDTLLITYLRGNFDAGIYTAGYRFLEAIVFIPAAVSTAFFPITTSLFLTNPQKVYKMYRKVLKILFIASLLIIGLYLFVLPMIIKMFLPDYLASIQVIQILCLTIPFMFMISVQGVVMLSSRKFLQALIYMSIFNLSLNILMNFYLIPKYSFMGSAYSTVISDIIGFAIFYFYIKYQFKKLE